MKENIKFILKITFAHVVTYILCGIIFMNINNYSEWIDTQNNWRDASSIIYQLSFVFQILRGILYAIIILIIKDIIIGTKFGILKLFVIMIILGIINTPGTGPMSIEEFIYMVPSDEPLNVRIGGLIEIITQNLLFCIIVCTNWKELKNKIFKKKI